MPERGMKSGIRRADEMLLEFYSYATFICCEFRGTRRVFRNEYMVEVGAFNSRHLDMS